MSDLGIEFVLFILGVLIAVASYLLKNYVFDPHLNFDKVRGRIHHQLKYHARAFGQEISKELQDDASEAMRRASCDLEEAYFAISFQMVTFEDKYAAKSG